MLSRRDGVRSRCVDNEDAVLGGSRQIDVVNTHARAADHLEAALGRLEDFAGHLCGKQKPVSPQSQHRD